MINESKLQLERAKLRHLLESIPRNWITVRERSFTAMFKEYSIGHRASTLLLDICKEHRLLEVTGTLSGMRYRRLITDSLVQDAVDLIIESIRKDPTYSKRTFVATYVRKEAKIEQNTVVHRKPIRVGDFCWVIHHNKPVGALIKEIKGTFKGGKLAKIQYVVTTYPDYTNSLSDMKLFASKEDVVKFIQECMVYNQ